VLQARVGLLVSTVKQAQQCKRARAPEEACGSLAARPADSSRWW